MRNKFWLLPLGSMVLVQSMMTVTPDFDGVEDQNSDMVQEIALDNDPLSEEFQYVPIPSSGQADGLTQARNDFKDFIKNDLNAGLLVDFLQQFDAASLKLLKRKVLGSTSSSVADSKFWQQMKAIGADTEALEEARKTLWKPHEKRYNKSFKQLRRLEDSFDELQQSGGTEELQGQADNLRKTIAALRAQYYKNFRLNIAAIEKELNKNFFDSLSDDYGHLTGWILEKLDLLSEMVPNAKRIKVKTPEGEEVERNLFEELAARVNYITEFARAAGKISPEKYGLTYVLSWVFTDQNVDVAIEAVEQAQAEKMEEVGEIGRAHV